MNKICKGCINFHEDNRQGYCDLIWYEPIGYIKIVLSSGPKYYDGWSAYGELKNKCPRFKTLMTICKLQMI